MSESDGQSDTEDAECVCCGADLDYSAVAVVRGYCDACKPDECPECGCQHVKQRQVSGTEGVQTKWECDNGCFFEVTAP